MSPSWMIGDKPGEILGLMAQATRDMAPVGSKRGEDGGTSTTAQSVFNSVRTALVAAGITVQVSTTEVEHHLQSSLYVTVMVSVIYCAPDGSYVVCGAPGGATAPNRKSTQAALTAAVKSIHRHTFLMEVLDAGQQPVARMSDELVAHGRYLSTLNDADELRQANAHPTALALAPEDWGAASELWDARQAQLVNLEGMDKRAWQKARLQEAESDDAKRKAFARNSATKVPKGKPADLSNTQALTAKPSKRNP